MDSARRQPRSLLLLLVLVGCDPAAPDPDASIQASCDPFVAPPHASFAYAADGGVAIVNCDDGYTANRRGTFACESSDGGAGRWVGDPVHCVGPIYDDPRSDLEWEAIPASPPRSRPDAIAYCEALVLAGKDDFRLPSLREMIGVVRGFPEVDVTDEGGAFLGLFPETQVTLWTSTESSITPGRYYTAYIGKSSGGLDARRTDLAELSERPFTCVRGPVAPDASLTETSTGPLAGTIADASTGLTWLEMSDGVDRTIEQATAFCANIAVGGSLGWRVPTTAEFVTILDYTDSNIGFDAGLFTLNGATRFWAANQGIVRPDVADIYGTVSSGMADVICVR